MLYNDPKNLLQKRINEALGKSEESIVTELVKMSMMKKASKDKDALLITEVFNLLGVEKFTQLITLLDGKTLTLPTKEDFKENLLIILCYYWRDVKGLSWNEIKEKIGTDDLNSVKMGIKASQFGAFLKELMEKRFSNE